MNTLTLRHATGYAVRWQWVTRSQLDSLMSFEGDPIDSSLLCTKELAPTLQFTLQSLTSSSVVIGQQRREKISTMPNEPPR